MNLFTKNVDSIVAPIRKIAEQLTAHSDLQDTKISNEMIAINEAKSRIDASVAEKRQAEAVLGRLKALLA